MFKGLQKPQPEPNEQNTHMEAVTTIDKLAADLKVSVSDLNLVLDALNMIRMTQLTPAVVNRITAYVKEAGPNLKQKLNEQFKSVPQHESIREPETNPTIPFPSTEFSGDSASQQEVANTQALAFNLQELAQVAQLDAGSAGILRSALAVHYMANPDQMTDPQAIALRDKAREIFTQGLKRMGEYNLPLALGLTGIPELQALPSVQNAMQEFTQAYPSHAHLLPSQPITNQRLLNSAEPTK